jgi:hypothetical protein
MDASLLLQQILLLQPVFTKPSARLPGPAQANFILSG